jgi:hypothetical protein
VPELVLPWLRLGLFGHAAGHLVGPGVFLVLPYTSKTLEVEGSLSVAEFAINPKDSEVPDNAATTRRHTWWRSRGCSSIGSQL